MVQTFAMNQNQDLYIGPDGNLAIASGISAVLFACKTAAQAQLGEMFLNVQGGVNNFGTVWRDSANIAQFELYVRNAILSVDGVVGIATFNTDVRNNAVFYTATIETIYGTGALDG